MKKYLTAAIALFCSVQLTAQTQAEFYVEKKFSNVKITNAFVETTGGNITVTGSNTAETRVEVYVQQNDGRRGNSMSKEEIKQKMEKEYELIVSASGNKLTATARRLSKNERDWQHTLSISFKLFVPQNVATDLHTSGGNITMSNLTGNQEFRTSGGDLTLEKLAGTVSGKTSGGNIRIKDSKDNLDLTTSGGNIYADNCSGKMDLITSGGNLDLAELKGSIHARTSGGDVHGDHISGDLTTQTSGGSITVKQLSGSIDASTSAGNIDLSVTSLAKKINLTNSSGSIYLQLPKNLGMDLKLTGDNVKTGTLPGFKGRQEKEHVEGSLNGGGIPVRVNANNGTVHVSLQ